MQSSSWQTRFWPGFFKCSDRSQRILSGKSSIIWSPLQTLIQDWHPIVFDYMCKECSTCMFGYVCLGLCVLGGLTSHLNILSALFCPYVTTFMQIQPLYINSDYNIWRFGTAPFESTLKAGLPKGGRISSCVNVCLFTLAIVCVCVLCL